jgi:hypothetical protein
MTWPSFLKLLEISPSHRQTVEGAWVVHKHLVDHGAGHILPDPHIGKDLRLPRRIATTPTAAVMALCYGSAVVTPAVDVDL